MKKPYFIIGLLLSTLWGAPLSLAQGAAVNDCNSTLYDDVFKCQARSLASYCSKVGTSADFNIYGKTYCDISKNSDDEIFKVLAQQFSVEDPKFNDPGLLKFILFDIQKSSLRDYLQSKYGNANATDKLPEIVRQEYFEKKAYDGQNAILQRVKTAFNQQKVIHQTKEALKSQFKAKEIWANGSLSDSPFDLVVDLNLIEQVLFGNQATWVNANDVWRWPQNPEEEALKAADGDRNKANDPNNNNTNTGNQNQTPPDQYECKPADSGDSKTAGKTTSDCGNGQIDTGEACDDGNQNSGDGCSNTCSVEPGADAMCRDIDAVNLKPFDPNKPGASSGGAGNTNANNAPISCPPGTVATKIPANQPKQLLNYGGPLVGGVLRNFPVSNQPDCPPGSTPFGFDLAGQTQQTCVPNQLCADPNDLRDFLYTLAKAGNTQLPSSWVDLEDDNPLKSSLTALEASICVAIKKVNRPTSAYPVTANCIDCHIQAMNDGMNTLLSKNIAPLQNTMQSFGSSNRWGPTASFNLNVTTQSLKNFIFNPKYSGILAKKVADQAILELQQDTQKKQDVNGASSNTNRSSTSLVNILNKDNTDKTQQSEEFYQNLKQYQMITDASADRNVHGPLMGLLTDLQNSFGRIQAQYVNIAANVTKGNSLRDKNMCPQ